MFNCFFSLRSYPTEKTVSVTKNNYDVKLQTYVALHVKPPFFFSILPKSECVENDSKSPKHFPPPENSPGGSKAVMC